DETLGQQLADYLTRFDSGEDPLEAFVNSFGSIEKIQGAINDYRNRTAFPVLEFPGFEYEGEMTVRDLTRGEELYLLADVAVERGGLRRAHEYFDEVLELGIESSLVAKVQSRRSIAF